MFIFSAHWWGRGVGRVGLAGAGRLQSGWKCSFTLITFCTACAGVAGYHGLWCACRRLWVPGGAQTLHKISKALLVSNCYHSCGGPWFTFILVWMLWVIGRWVGRIFTACLKFFVMGEMGLGARNFKFFWRRHYICLVVVFCWAEVLLLLVEMSLGWFFLGEILADES